MLKLVILLAAVAVCYGQVDNRYYLYTEDNKFYHETIEAEPQATELQSKFFKASNPTTILIHGHGGSVGEPFNTLTRANILNYNGPHNVIVVDWEARAGFSYADASRNVPFVAQQLADFIEVLADYVTPAVVVSELHLVGFGLGAHVAGIASRQLTNGVVGVGRITGLDPSGSGWGTNSDHLRANDADYVEVIHTDGSGLLANGIETAIGRVNFYANGGSNQPGCLSHACSHNRAYELFAASLEHAGHLKGSPCSSKTQLNLNLCSGPQLPLGGIELSKTGQSHIYRVNTGRRYPF